MTIEKLQKLENSIRKRGTLVAERFRPGLSQRQIRRVLREKLVTGNVETLVAIYTWRDGTDLHARNPFKIEPYVRLKADLSIFPKEPFFFFPSLEMSLAQFTGFSEYSESRPSLREAIGRYFPVFWDGAIRCLCLDISEHGNNQVLDLFLNTERPIRVLYPSFGSFVDAAVRANLEGEELSAFASQKRARNRCRE